MKAIVLGALLGLVLALWPSALPLTAAHLTGQPAVLVCVLCVLTRPALVRRWTR